MMSSLFLTRNLQEKITGNGMDITVINFSINAYNNISSISLNTNSFHDSLVIGISRSSLGKLPCIQVI